MSRVPRVKSFPKDSGCVRHPSVFEGLFAVASAVLYRNVSRPDIIFHRMVKGFIGNFRSVKGECIENALGSVWRDLHMAAIFSP